MLSGQLPFHADSAIELIVKHVKEAPPPLREVLPTVPEAIERVVMRALEKDPAQRYQSAPELSRAFEEAAQDETSRSDAQTIVDARPPQPSDPTVVVGAAVKTDDMAARAVSTGGGQAAAAQAVHSTSGAADQAILQPPSRLPIKALAAVILIAIVGVVLYFALRPSSTSEKKGVEPAPTEMVLIPGGKFMMGRNDGEDDERPAHEVEVKSFYLDKYEVTNQQYKKFVDATSHPAPRHWKNNGSYAPDEATLPVTHINWQDAVAYAKWAGKRLPTEEEWEYAARGGKSNLYPWGNEWEAAKANVGQQDKKKPAPVGAFAMDRSAFGVYDMAGNVSEWVQNFFTKYGSGQTFEKYKVYRGGNFADEPKTCTATYRWLDEPTLPVDQMPRVGFRCAKDAGQ
jgi:serine/threonine-protein kinase